MKDKLKGNFRGDSDSSRLTDMNEKTKERIEQSHYLKFQGIVPEGFVMIPEVTLNKLKEFDFWNQWINDPTLLHNEAVKDTKENLF